MTTRIQLRRGTAAQWTDADPTLALGEAGIETDTQKWKVGDGTTVWSELPYMIGDYNDANVATFLSAFGSNVVSTTGNITAGNFYTTGFASANLLYADTSISSGNIISATGNVFGGNLRTSGSLRATEYISTSGNVTGNYFIGDGSQLTGITTSSNKIFNGNSYANIATANGNVVVSANGNAWSFGTDGTLTFPDNSGSGWPINTQRFGMGNIGAWLDGQWTIGEFSGNGVVGTVGIRIDPAIEGPVGMTFPSSETSNTQPVQIYSTNGGGIALYTGGNNWVFDSNGQINIPEGSNSFDEGRIQSANGYPTLLGYGSGEHGGPELDWMDSNDVANAFMDNTVLRNTMYINDGGLYVGMNENGVANVAVASWRLAPNGGTIFPTLNVARGDNPSGNITGQTLLFGDANQEAIISTPDGVPGNEYSQRLVINPGAGNNYGEGGDIYLWAGRGGNGSGSGGDIKIRGGQGGANTEGGSGGDGGYIRMEAGDAASTGGYAGYINITGGSSNAVGGYVTIAGGSGQTQGGDANINGGYTNSGPGGRVNINGGGSGSGLSEYGNVNIVSGASTWTFNNTGNLVLPQTGVIYETNIPFGGLSGKTIALAPYGGTSADQQLLVYPTAGPDANHLHLTSGNLYNTELFLGNDNLYVKLANTGNVVVNANDNNGNSFQYVFGADSTITFPDSGLTIDSGYNSGYAGFVAGSGVSAVMTELYSSGNTAAQILLNRPQVDHTIQLSLYPDSSDPATTWTFDDTGNLTTPGLGGDITMTGGNIHGANIVTANTFVSTAYNVVTAGNLLITSQYGLGVTGTILEQGGTLELIGNGTGAGTTGCVVIGWNSSYSGGLGPVAQMYFNPPGSSGNALITTGNLAATSYNWNFDDTGNLNAPGNINAEGTVTADGLVIDTVAGISVQFGDVDILGTTGLGGNINAVGANISGNVTADYFIGDGSQLTNLPGGGSYGNANVADFLADFGSNVLSTTGNVSASDFIATGNANVLTLTTRNGDSNNSNASPQIIMGYAGTADYPQFIHTTHNASTPVDNTIEFWTSDGTQAGTFPANAVLGLTVTNGNIETGGISATGNVLGNGYARFSGTFDESQASTAGLYLGYAGGTPRMMFGTGNTQQTFEIDNDAGTLRFYQPGSTKASLTADGVLTANTTVTTPKALSSLTAVAGARAFVNNGNLVAAGNFGAEIGGGGSNIVPVWSDGINWYVG